MSDIYTSVIEAYENAVQVPPDGPAWVSEGEPFYRAYADLADTDPIQLPGVRTDSPNEALAEASESNLDALSALCGILGFPEEWTKEVVPHELSHWKIAQQLGATAGQFGIRFTYRELEEGTEHLAQLFLNLPGFTTTKLGFAIVQGAPDTPSKADEVAYTTMGYTDLDDIAARAQRLNNQGVLLNNGRPYPVLGERS